MNPRYVWRVALIDVMITLQYRGAFLLLMVNTVATPLISLLVWVTVSDQGVRLPYDRGTFVTYFVLLSVVSMLTSTWAAEYVAESIRLGGLSPWLLRPVPSILSYAGNNIAEKIVKLPLLLPLVALVALAFRHNLRLPSSPAAWLLFALCLPMAAAVAFLLDIAVGSLAFWVQDVRGIIRVKDLLGALLAGQVVPLALFPPSMAGFLEAQPFRYTVSFPLEILTGRLSTAALLRGFGYEALYCALLWACYRVLWRHGLRVYSATGA